MLHFSKSKKVKWLVLIFVLAILIGIFAVYLSIQAASNQKNNSFINNRQGEAPQDGLYLAPVRIGFLWGFINQNGQIEIEPQYLAADDFSDNLALVLTDKGLKYIDKTGSVAFEINIENGKSFSEGLASIKKNGKWGYIDINGNIVIEPRFDIAEPFSEGLAVVSENGIKSGYIDMKGTYVIEPKYDMALSFSDGMAFVYPNSEGADPNNRKAYIGRDGNVVFQPTLKGYNYDLFSEGLAMIYNRDNLRYGYMNKKGEIVIETQFEKTMHFSEGLAAVQDNNTCQFIDVNGNIIISDINFDYTKSFSEGMAAVLADRSWGFIDKQGKLLIDFELLEVGNFSKVD